MKDLIKIIFFLLYTLITTSVIGQDPLYIQYTQKDGFPAASIYSNIIQGDDGIIWIPTDQGLVRYDGISFELMPVVGTTDHEYIQCEMDQYGSIWLVNNTGELSTKPFDSDTIEPIVDPQNGKRVAIILSNGIAVSEHAVWFCALDPSISKLIRLNLINHELEVTPIFRGRVIVSGNKIIHRRKYDLGEIKEHNKNYILNPLCTLIKSDLWIKPYVMDGLYHKFLLTYKKSLSDKNSFPKISILDNEDGHVIKNLSNTTFFYEPNILIEDHILWTSPNGIIHMDSTTYEILASRTTLPNTHCTSIMRDHENGVWVGTADQGLFYFPSLFSHLTTDKYLENVSISSLTPSENKNGIWIGTNNGMVYFMNPKGQLKEPILIEEGQQIYSIEEANDLLLIANPSNKMLYNLKKNRFEDIPRKFTVNGALPAGAKQIAAITPIQYLYSTGFDVRKLDCASDSNIISIIDQPVDRTYRLLRDSLQNRTWCIGSQNAFYYNIGNNDIVNVDLNHNTRINDLCISADTTLWLAAPDQLFYYRDDILTQLDLGDMDYGVFNKIISDGHQLFVGTSTGVLIIDIKSKKWLHTIDRTEGLPDEHITALLKQDNILWMGTNSGLYHMDLTTIKKNMTPPKIHIKTFRIWGNLLDPNEEHNLSHAENDIFVEFAPLSFQAQGLEQSKYRLLGYDTTWTYVASDVHELRFPNLAPGDYTFQIKAINEDLVESEFPAEIKFKIQPPFWQRWYFILGCIVAASGLLTLYITNRQRKEHQRHTEKMNILRQLDQLKEAAMRSQMNPHFLFNSLNSIMQFLIQNDKRASMDYLAQFSQLMRFVFEYSQLEEITLEEEIKFLKTYLSLEELRFGSNVAVDLTVDSDLPLSYIKLPPLLLQPLVENAFKHGLLHKEEAGNVKIRINAVGDHQVKLTISDDGVGRLLSAKINKTKFYEKAREITSTQIIHDRIALYNTQHQEFGREIALATQDLNPNDTKTPGTCVVVDITY